MVISSPLSGTKSTKTLPFSSAVSVMFAIISSPSRITTFTSSPGIISPVSGSVNVMVATASS